MSYLTLDAAQIVGTLRRLKQRVVERFPASGLSEVCRQLVGIAETSLHRSQAIAAPNLALRAAILIAVAAGVTGLAYVVRAVRLQVGDPEIFGIFQGVEAAMNIVVLVGAALFFLISLETRIKRRRALRDLHVFRSIAHVIDMHQLTRIPASCSPAASRLPRRQDAA